jgi:ABC transport system ATP-binding/permease protein
VGNQSNNKLNFAVTVGAQRSPQQGMAGGSLPLPKPAPQRPPTVKLKEPSVMIQFPGKMPIDYPLTGEINIGREQSNHIVIPLSTVSRFHAKIIPHNGSFAIVDLGSSNGTYLQGSRIPAQKPVPIPDSSTIRIGDGLGNSITLAVQMGIANNGLSRQKVSLSKADLANVSRLTIGRDPKSDIHLNSPLVSWHHAEIHKIAGGFEIRDLGSTNGTFINGKRITGQVLQYHDQIYIASYQIFYNTSGLSATPNTGSIRLDCINLTKTIPLKPVFNIPGINGNSLAGPPAVKAILNNVNLSVMPREFVALIGGSGRVNPR